MKFDRMKRLEKHAVLVQRTRFLSYNEKAVVRGRLPRDNKCCGSATPLNCDATFTHSLQQRAGLSALHEIEAEDTKSLFR